VGTLGVSSTLRANTRCRFNEWTHSPDHRIAVTGPTAPGTKPDRSVEVPLFLKDKEYTWIFQ
jgi:hypothetical protein